MLANVGDMCHVYIKWTNNVWYCGITFVMFVVIKWSDNVR